MADPKVSTLEALFGELYKDPEFRKEYDRQKPYYDLILEVIRGRKRLGLTQQELAEKAGKQQSAISRIESGEYNIRFKTLIEIAEALEAKVEIKLVPKFHVADEDYTELLEIQATSAKAETFVMHSSDEGFVGSEELVKA